MEIVKRNGKTVEYSGDKIFNAILPAMLETGIKRENIDEDLISKIEKKVKLEIESLKKMHNKNVTVEQIQNTIESLLVENNLYSVAKKYILYRKKREGIRNGITMNDYLDKIESYLDDTTWETKENSNTMRSFGTLNKYISETISKDYWKYRIYSKDIREAVDNGDIHIHDLGSLAIYCCGYSLEDLIRKGIRGIANIPVSHPAKHFGSILAQLANIITIFQNEIAGAVAFSSFDTLLAPFVKKDNLTYEEVYQNMQAFIFQVNSNSRGGSEPAFSNLTFDLTPDNKRKKQSALIGKEYQDFVYGDCQDEMDMINKAFCEIMIKGDGDGGQFSYPIPTYNIHKEWDWDDVKHDSLWELTGKFGSPYFANFINTDMKPEDARSMCCRLRLDLREIVKRTGGLFGAGEKTGSIGVVTVNLPRLGYTHKNKPKEELFKAIKHQMGLANKSLIAKRAFLQEQLDLGLYPAFSEYVGTLAGHFSTIGYVGMNEMLVNYFDDNSDITSEKGNNFAYETLTFMNEVIKDYQEENEETLYNLEASPAEATAYRLALKDKKMYPEIFTQGDDEPYYTNSCHVPVNRLNSIDSLYRNQHELQALHSGGTVIHNYIDSNISGEQAKAIIKHITETYKAPYTSISPVYSICPTHGYIQGYNDTCPICGVEVESYQRITGYVRPISRFNNGKYAEFKDRNQMNGDKID